MLLGTREITALQAAGITVRELPGWQERSHGPLPAAPAIVWHHDASPPGDSPGSLDWMVGNWDHGSANCWVDRYGAWTLVGCGVAWHAGTVLPGMPGNHDSVGIETDHTIGEAWPTAQLDSLRAGTAALLNLWHRRGPGLYFHKQICSPPGRKPDPDGLDLATERAAVARLRADPKPTTTEGITDVIVHTTTSGGNDVFGLVQADGIHYIRRAWVLNMLRKGGVKIEKISRGEYNKNRAANADTAAVK